MKRGIIIFLFIIGFILTLRPDCLAQKGAPSQEVINELRQEIQKLREQMDAQRIAHESKMKEMQEKLDALAVQQVQMKPEEAEEALEDEVAQSQREGVWSKLETAVRSMNPEISVIADTLYYNDDTDTNEAALRENIAGFSSHGHGHEETHGHEHGSLENGFNLREVELWFSADVDPYFKAYATLAFSEEGSEVEEMVFKTSSLPAGFQLMGGKFFSRFGRINRQHPHEWDFVERPLIYQMTLGGHGLNEKGLGLSWLAPTRHHLLFGLEALQGENEGTFNYTNGDEFPSHDGPRTWVGWAKFAPNLPQKHGLQIGVFGAFGVDQREEAFEEDEHEHEHEDEHEHENGEELSHLDGDSSFWGLDLVYKYDAGREYGHKNFIFQGEYFRRHKDLDIFSSPDPDFVGLDSEREQDGLYVQALYGFLPRWRTGFRWDAVGFVNEREVGHDKETFDESYRYTGMVDFSPTEFSRLRLQVTKGDYALEEGMDEDFWQVFVQGIFSLGAHGAHAW